MATVPGSPKRGYRTIRLPLAKESYAHFLSDGSYCRRQLDGLYRQHPELFPEGWEAGYVLCGKTPRSRKQGIRCQRVRLVAGAVGYTVAPTFVTPYLAGRTAEVEKALFLMRFHGPCWALADVFGRDAMSWYRLEQALGRCSVVGTTVQAAERWAQDWVADEKHSRLAGDKISSATTAGDGGILGASVVDSACEEELHRAYGVFAEEARDVAPDYQPETVNTDGWAATPGAWKRLFPNIAVILCFLHAFLKIRDRATQALSDYFEAISRRVWEAYRAQGKAGFAQRLRRLREWAERTLPDSPMKSHTLELCKKRQRFSCSYDHARAHRTSNLVDRWMRFLDRACFNAQYFHGTPASAELRVRALALLWNFCPSSPRTVRKHQGLACPAERLNGKRYTDSWLENLPASGAMNGLRNHQQNPL